MTPPFVLMSFALALIAGGCQKETEPCLDEFNTSRESPSCGNVLSYTVDWIVYHAIVCNDSSCSRLIDELLALAQEGHHIKISWDGSQKALSATKDVITYSTTDKEKMDKWLVEMKNKGYEVDFYFRDGTYYGSAFKR